MKLGTFLADAAVRHPRKPALVSAGGSLDFATLDARATRLANAFFAHGGGAGDRVALVLPNSPAAVELMCAMARAGAIIVPIPSRLAKTEVEFILADCRPGFLFFDAGSEMARAVAGDWRDGQTVAVGAGEQDRLEAFARAGSDAPVASLPALPDDLVLGYTSGTTGHPKGAIGTHSSLVVGGYMTAVEYGYRTDDVVLITSPIAHRVGLSRVVNMVCLAMTSVLMERFDPGDAVTLIAAHGVTTISVVPTIARRLAPEFERRADECASLLKLSATGEAFPVDLKRRLQGALPNLGLHTSYAQTEAGLVASLRPEEQATHAASVGRPLPGVEVRLVDPEMRDVAPGEPGEVLVRAGEPGSLVMRGYFERPEANAEAFVDGWLRTGDLCRADADGYLYFVDRLKDMIVTGGLNVYAKEVETALVAHPRIADAAVVGVPDAEFGEAVRAFIELEPGQSMTAAAVADFCRTRLASYKKPRHVQFVEAMPRTASGKVRKAQLRALYPLEGHTD